MSETPAAAPAVVEAAAPLPRGMLAAFVLALGAALGLLGIAVKTVLTPRPAEPDLAAGAWRLLERGNVAPLTQDLQTILKDWPRLGDRTQEHPLLGQPAPDFDLPVAGGGRFRLSEAVRRGPVAVVFYYGYYCDHCVAQLFDLERHRRYFAELGVELVALSADTPETTLEQFDKYRGKGGAFGFAVASDAENQTARRYGCYQPYEKGSPARPETQLHGTFLVDREGVVRWANTGLSPYTNVRSLLGEFASLRAGAASGNAPAGPGPAGKISSGK